MIVLSFSILGFFGCSTPLAPQPILVVAPSISFSGMFVATQWASIGLLTPTNTGGSITSCSVSPDLPSGMILSKKCVISGSPTVMSSSTVYTLTATNESGSSSASVAITVNAQIPSGLTYSLPIATYVVGSPLVNNVPSNSGGAITSYISIPALPSGLNFDTTTGIISGTPTSQTAASTYVIRGTNTGGSIDFSISIAVINPVAISNLHSNQMVETGFVVGTAVNTVSEVGCQFDSGSIQSASGTTTWSCQLPSGANTWKILSRHTITVGIKSGSSISNAVMIEVVKGQNRDINGDGYPDLVVSAPAYSSSAGAAYIYYGGPSFLSSSPAITLTGAVGSVQFGNSIVLGDFNGDGYADVTVGAFNLTDGNKNTVSYYPGGSQGVSTLPTVTLSSPAGSLNTFGWSLAAGDINGDGYVDLAVGDYDNGAVSIYNGGNSGITSNPSTSINNPAVNNRFGYSMDLGDLNGDGYADLVVGAYASGFGAAYIYSGTSSGLPSNPSQTITGPSGGSSFGSTLVVGDLNGDSYADVIVGKSVYDVASSTSSVYIFNGGATGTSSHPSVTLSGYSVPNWNSGIAMGDFNGDGFQDLIVGGFGGLFYLFNGSGTGVSTTPYATNHAIPGAGNLNAVAASDLNGDGRADIIVGVPSNTALGSVYLYGGTNSVFTGSPIQILNGLANGEYFGNHFGL